MYNLPEGKHRPGSLRLLSRWPGPHDGSSGARSRPYMNGEPRAQGVLPRQACRCREDAFSCNLKTHSGGSTLNKRKRVALQKHRAKQRKLEEKRKAARVASTIAPSRVRATAEPERPAPITPAPRPAAPRRPRTAPRPPAAQEPQQDRGPAQGQRQPSRPAPRRAPQQEPSEQPDRGSEPSSQ